MSNLLLYLQDPAIVCWFQECFGVEKVAEEKSNKSDIWVAIQTKDNYTGTKDKGGDILNTTSAKSSYKMHQIEKDRGRISDHKDKEDLNIIYYKISNKFWYHLFSIGSLLGHEAWYAFVFSYLFWNVDGSVGRKVILVANFVFYIGQGLKDIIQWPRPPMPPVVRLEQRWEAEYGMPSTHAMMALSLPLSIVVFSLSSPFVWVWMMIGSFWCVIVCCCRLYLGMHSLADVLAGLGVSLLILICIIPLAQFGDYFFVSSPVVPLLTLSLSIFAVIVYPVSDKWTPARAETTFILGGYFGTQLGCWLGFQLGFLHQVISPYPIFSPLPISQQIYLGLVRVVLGLMCLAVIHFVFKPFSFQIACLLLNTDKHTLQQQDFNLKNKKKLAADLFCKFMTFSAIGFGITFLCPLVFQILGCDRPSYWTEVGL